MTAVCPFESSPDGTEAGTGAAGTTGNSSVSGVNSQESNGDSVGSSAVGTVSVAGYQRYSRWSRQDSSDINTDDEGATVRRLTPLERLNLELEDDQPLLVLQTVENTKAIFAGGQKNHTPDFETVEQADSETGVSSNSSADFPSPAQAADMKPGAPGGVGPLQEGSIDAVVASAVSNEVPGSKDAWIDRSPPSVILQQHRSDEM